MYDQPLYCIEVYGDHAIINGKISMTVFTILIKLCKK